MDAQLRRFKTAYDFGIFWLENYGRLTSPAGSTLNNLTALPLHRCPAGEPTSVWLPKAFAYRFEVNDTDLDAIEANVIMRRLKPIEKFCYACWIWHCKREKGAYNDAQKEYPSLTRAEFSRVKNTANTKIHFALKSRHALPKEMRY